jgi:hypothetical protein
MSNPENIKAVIDLCVTKSTELMNTSLIDFHTEYTARLDSLMIKKELLGKRIEDLERQVTVNNLHMDLLQRKLDDLEQYTRRPNIVIDGIYVKQRESANALRSFVMKEITGMGLEVSEIDIDRVHRHEDPYTDNQGFLVQPVIVRFTSWFARNEVYSARRKLNYRIRADLTPRRKQILDSARDLIASRKLNTIIDFVAADRNCRLIVRTTSGAFHGFSSETEFSNLVDRLTTSDYRGQHNKYSIKDFQKYLLDHPTQASTSNSDFVPDQSFAGVVSASTPTAVTAETSDITSIDVSTSEDFTKTAL